MKKKIPNRSTSPQCFFPKCLIIFLIIMGFVSIAPFFSNNEQILSLVAEIPASSHENIITLPPKGSTVHNPIVIQGSNWSTCDAVTGNGTVNDPYVIANLSIDGEGITGILIYDSNAYGIIRNCTIWGGSDGIHLLISSNINITNNTVYNNKYNGIKVFCSIHCTLTRNIAINNSYNGYYIKGDEMIIQDIRYIRPDFLSVTENIAINNSFSGFYMRGFGSSDFSNNTGDSNLNGIYMEYAFNSTFIANSMKDNLHAGIYSLYSDNCIYLENRAYNQSSGDWSGFSFNWVTNCTISRNLAIQNNGMGIHLGSSFNCVVWENNVSANGKNGIHLYGGSSHYIARNTINDNYGYGILIRYSYKKSIITNNWIINNKGGDIIEGEGIGISDDIYDNIIQTYRKIHGYPSIYLLYSGGILILLKKKLQKK